ncbi:MAG: lipid biosynthesis B12-binding/radical SAM protein [Proteobacteria bacterium]|nr:lipid biosynthesis B12-binding/radical SAM protein [Pseudomonadota bacterium]MBU1708805.1 lipid biosynthesis B12-binding/radical SAM protein [Pseudomonadota bacterium]
MGIDCLLISTNQVVTPFPVYPLGVAHLVGALEEAGHRAFHYDILANGGTDSLEKYLADFRPALVGLSIRNLDTVDSTAPRTYIDAVVKTMEIVRKCTSVPVVLGGPAFSILPEELLDFLKADYGVIGEGELLLPWLADQIETGKPPKERILRSEPSDTPWRPVKYDKQAVDYYLGWGGMLNIQTKRGCPYNCGYCSYPSLEGNRYRFRDPEAVADDVMRVSREFGAPYIFFTDSVFNDAAGHYLKVAEALIRAGNKTPWCGYFRPNKIEKDHLDLLVRSGLSAMELGTDASTDTTLAGLDKGFSFDDVLRFDELARDSEISCAHFIIFGGPGETEETLVQGLKNVEKLDGSVVFAFSGIRILPGTAIFERAVREGVIAPDQPMREPVFYFSPEIAEQKINEMVSASWKGRFDRIYPASMMEDRIRHLHHNGHVGPMWDFLVRSRKK